MIGDNDRVLKPRKKVSIRDIAGALGSGDEDEVEFAILDLEFIPEYYERKYGGAIGKKARDESDIGSDGGESLET